jgi:hypothetical protein
MAQHPSEKKIAARALVSFLAQYSQFLEELLGNARADMQETVERVMAEIFRLNATNEDKKKAADDVIALRRPNVTSGSYAEVFEHRQQVAQTTAPKDEYERELQTHMARLGELDKDLQSLIFGMLGALSADDVIGQRLAHVQQSLGQLRLGLASVIRDFDSYFEMLSIHQWGVDLAKDTFNRYTTEAEKDIFLKIYGKQPK